MPEATFDVQTITPLFLAGADQTTAELRTPSFRGGMRYWTRALVGGLAGTSQEGLTQVKEAESAIFGTTDKGSGVKVKLSPQSTTIKQFTDNISKPGSRNKSTGKGYLLWSMRLKKQPRFYFAPGTRFQLHLMTNDEDITKYKKGVAALWLLTHLGGIGSRSRRCAGSLTITLHKGDIYDFSFHIPNDTNALKIQLEQGIQAARSLYKVSQFPNSDARFDVLSRNDCSIWILQQNQPWGTPEIAMEAIGESLQSYRSRIPLIHRKVFGFPLKGVNSNVERRSSPLLLRVIELQGNKFVGLAVLFKTRNSDVSMTDYMIIEKWVNEFSGRKEIQI